MKHFPILLLAIAMSLSACAPEAAPTINPVDVQSTAVAAAFTIVAETQAAIPTATPLPPTETASPTLPATNTPLTLPTLEAAPTTAPVNTPGGDPCAKRVLSAPKGRPTRIRIVNTTKTEVTVSLYLNETASHGECGYRSFTLAKSNDTVFNDLVQGCYNLWAWSNDPQTPFQVQSVTSCINNADKWTFEISTGNIKFIGP
ncbi:MAG TPA: hypothetical protein VI524_10250 [Anaerolineales bacterium]|nr:hypothetical protein [Anaerolineales bacterium]